MVNRKSNVELWGKDRINADIRPTEAHRQCEMEKASQFKIIVIGGGLGGLTFALACLRYGVSIDLYEQAQTFGTVGAGVEIGPNAVKVLNQLGLEKEFEAISSPFSPKYMVFEDINKVDGRYIDIIELEKNWLLP